MAAIKTQNFRGIRQVQVQDLGQVLHRTQSLVKESLVIVPIKFLNYHCPDQTNKEPKPTFRSNQG